MCGWAEDLTVDGDDGGGGGGGLTEFGWLNG